MVDLKTVSLIVTRLSKSECSTWVRERMTEVWALSHGGSSTASYPFFRDGEGNGPLQHLLDGLTASDPASKSSLFLIFSKEICIDEPW